MSEILPEAAGKTVKTITQAHRLNEPKPSGDIIVEFVDGSKIHVYGVWCNDSTADTEAIWTWLVRPGRDRRESS